MKFRVLIAALMVLDAGASSAGKHHHHRHHNKQHHRMMGHGRTSMDASFAQRHQLPHNEFYMHREMINEREHNNLQMFETLNTKLTDEEFINQAILNNERLVSIEKGDDWSVDDSVDASKNATAKKNNSSSEYELFKTPPAGPIFKNASHKTEKIKTRKQSNDSSPSEITMRNVTTHGPYKLTEGFEAVLCAKEGKYCNCLGQVHFGEKADSFAAMHEKNVSIVDTRGIRKSHMVCDAANFNVTNSTGNHQCYCVRETAPDPLPKAEHCAMDDEGMEFCSCYGTVYYGRKEDPDNDNKTLTFAQMLKTGWTSVISNGDLLCDSNSFDGDPDYGHKKQCFCEADPSYEPAPPVEMCALEKDKTDCVCTGTVYYGRANDPYENETALDFLTMKTYNFVSRQVDGAIGCNSQEFGDPVKGADKQCFCEQDQEPQVKRCATQDGSCTCNGGNVFYGLLEVEGTSPAGFEDMFENPFAVKYDVKGTVQCNAKTFGSDPAPGKAKQCFCDDVEFEDREGIEAELAFHAEQAEVTSIKAQAENQQTETTASLETAETIKERTQLKIAEEEARFAKEMEERVKQMEAERAKIQDEMDQKDAAEHDAELALDEEAHKEELAAKDAEADAKEAALEAASKKKAAEQADEKEKYKAQLEAQKAEAKAADKKRDLEFKQKKADAAAARLKQQKMKKELQEKNKLAQQELQTIRAARKDQMKAEKQKMRLESQRLLQEYEANRAATEAARTAAAIQKALEQAMAKEMKLAMKRAQVASKRREKEAKKREAEALRKQKLAEDEAAKQLKIEKAKELELERLANITKAEEARKEKMEQARKEEEARLKAADEAARKKQRDLEDQQLRALRAEAIAQSESDIKEAQELASKLSDELENTRKQRQKILDEKRELVVAKQQQKNKLEQLSQDAEKAKKELQAAKDLLAKKKEHSAKLKKETQAFIAKMKAQTQKAQAAAQAQIDKDVKEAQEATKKREAAAKEAREIDEKAHQAELKARKDLDKLQAEQHKKEMDAKKAEFEKTFKHLWGPGATGLSTVYATFTDKATADAVVSEAFKDTMISQVIATSGVTYEFKNETKLHLVNTGLHVDQNGARLEMVTTDDRIPELIETAIAVSGNENLDLVVVSMNSVSPDFKSWVQLQATEQDQTNAYYNVDAFGGDKPIAEKRVATMGDFQSPKRK